jgi:Zn-dependent protease with chaperone function
MSVTVLIVSLALAAPLRAKIKDVKIRGYVTNVTSPTHFEIEDYRISRDDRLELDFENATPDVRFDPSDIRVGVELQVAGTLDDATGELKAKSIKVDIEQFKPHRQTAILSQPPAGVKRGNDGWIGTFLVDGQRIQVNPRTEIVFKMTGVEKKLAKAAKETPEAEGSFQPLRSLADITTGMEMTYEGVRDRDGTILARRVEFARNDLEPGEKKMWDSLKVSTKPFNTAQSLAGELKISQVGNFKTLPDQEVQDYVSRLGEQLIPEYQRSLSPGDSNKIPFRFYVVQEKVPNAFALPNGVVVLHSGMFDVLQNEAQLAAVVGHEIAHSVQEHTWRQQQNRKGTRTTLAIGAAIAAAYGQNAIRDSLILVNAAIVSGYARTLENQSDRLGLEYMVNAGYDPREAPRVWKEMTNKLGDSQTNVFWSNHDNNTTRRSYLMNELKLNYANLRYSQFRTDEPKYHAMAERVRASGQRSSCGRAASCRSLPAAR